MPLKIECAVDDLILPDSAGMAKIMESIFTENSVKDGSLVITSVDEAEIAGLNQRFRGVLGPTDVLSFVLNGQPLEAEIYLCSGQILQSAAADNIPVWHETVKLVIHGILHILGYNHDTPEEKAENEAYMNRLLQKHLNA